MYPVYLEEGRIHNVSSVSEDLTAHPVYLPSRLAVWGTTFRIKLVWYETRPYHIIQEGGCDRPARMAEITVKFLQGWKGSVSIRPDATLIELVTRLCKAAAPELHSSHLASLIVRGRRIDVSASGTMTISALGIVDKTTAMLVLRSPSQIAILRQQEERVQKLEQVEAAARLLSEAAAGDSKQFELTMTNQDGNTIDLPETDRRGFTLGALLHAKGKASSPTHMLPTRAANVAHSTPRTPPPTPRPTCRRSFLSSAPRPSLRHLRLSSSTIARGEWLLHPPPSSPPRPSRPQLPLRWPPHRLRYWRRQRRGRRRWTMRAMWGA